MNFLTSELVFYIFAAMALVTALLVVMKSNPVGSAICMALCFAAAAAIMFQLDAQFLGVIQILVYTGAIMVLMLFVIMLLNLDNEPKVLKRPLPIICGLLIAGLFMAQLCGVVHSIPGAKEACTADKASEEECAFNDFLIGDSMPERLKAYAANDATAPAAAELSRADKPGFDQAYPAVGHSPAIQLPSIQLDKVSFPEGSSLAGNIERGGFPDTALLGHRLFARYNMELIIAGLTLLAATIGSVVLTRRLKND